MKTVKVQLDDKVVEISELPIGKYAQLVKALKRLPEHLAGLDKLDNDTILAKLPEIISDSLPEFLDILVIATPLKKQELETMGLKKIIKLVMAVVEANEYKEVYEMIKKVLARPELPKTPSI